MSRVQELRERRGALYQEARQMLDEAEKDNRDLAGEALEAWESRMAQVDAWGREIVARERDEQLADQLAQAQPEPKIARSRDPEPQPAGPPGTTKYDVAFRSYLRGGMRALTNEQVRTLNEKFITAEPGEQRALSTTGTAGGYMIPQGFLNDMVRVMKAYGSVRRVARVVRTDSGAAMPFPSVDDTANVGVILAENTQMAEQDVAWTTKTLSAYMYSSKLVRVSLQLMQDSAFNVEAELGDMLGERIGRIQNQHFTTGAGGGALPQGLTVGGTTGVTAASATVVTTDEIINLVHSVDPAYRNSGNATWMFGDTVLGNVRKLKDTTNQYLWQPGMQAGLPDRLFGYPIEINPDMPAPTTGNKSIAFGDFNQGYLIREVNGIQVIRFDERYMDYLQVGFTAIARADGIVRNASAYKLLVQA